MFDSYFKADPMNAEEGRRYRRELLEKGGSRPEMETLVAYLGRQPSLTAFYKELGLA
jgi:metallopeptidase MepB